eukprot:COSAG02_NODE_51147_length_316_cov_0.640553_1_plen_57_part_10
MNKAYNVNVNVNYVQLNCDITSTRGELAEGACMPRHLSENSCHRVHLRPRLHAVLAQ